MRYPILIKLLTVLVFVSCHQKEKTGFKKDASGMEYQIISDGSGGTPEQGQYLKLQVRQVYNDSQLSDTRSMLPQYQAFDSTTMTKESYTIFSKVRAGDSLVFKVSSDSAFKTSKPAFAKKKGWLFTYVKVEGILKSDVEAQADLEMEKAKKHPQQQPNDRSFVPEGH